MLWERITHLCRFTFFLLRCTLRAIQQFFIYLWSATSHMSKASIPNFNHSLPTCYSSTVEFLASFFSEVEAVQQGPSCCHIMDSSISVVLLSTLWEKALCLCTEANLPSCALELIRCISYVSLFGWWFILSCPLNFLSHLPLLRSINALKSISLPVRGKIRSERVFSIFFSPQPLSFLSLASFSYKEYSQWNCLFFF